MPFVFSIYTWLKLDDKFGDARYCISACRNAPDICHNNLLELYSNYSAWHHHVLKWFGCEHASSLLVYCGCGLLSAHPLAFTVSTNPFSL